MKIKEIFICLPVSNEEKYLRDCINSISKSVNESGLSARLLLCLNNCNDNSEQIAQDCKKKFRDLEIEIIKSIPGKLNAQKKMLTKVPPGKTVFFIDSDTEVSLNSIEIIVRELERNRELIAVGGFPIAKKYIGLNPWKKFLDKVLNIRSRHPQAEISKLDVTKYHSLAKKDPQCKNTTLLHEIKSKIFFHGRLFALRSKKYWNYPNPKKGVVGDDSYLPDYIIYNYGENRIRVRYDAITYFQPHTSITEHYRAYKRIFYDLENLRDNFPEFKEIRDHSVLILDKNYISGLKYSDRFYFFFFSIIRKIEKFFFRLAFNKNPSSIWLRK